MVVKEKYLYLYQNSKEAFHSVCKHGFSVRIFLLFFFKVKYDLNNPAKHNKLDALNNVATGLVFIIVVVNVFITAFGVQKPAPETSSKQ